MMSKTIRTIIIGNGLGMAVNPMQFSIDTGLKAAWNMLENDSRNRIQKLFTRGSEIISEEQLDKHYEAIQACIALRHIENQSQLKWLRKDARDFPDRFNDFVNNTAWHFFNQPSDGSDLIRFINSLKTFILNQNTITHLVTLNYDKLVYDHFCRDTTLMNGFSGKLVDGFLVESTGFSPSNLDSYYDSFGWYLHLHGSPLFYTNIYNGIINKSKFKNIYFEDDPGFIREHLILCNTKHKLKQISQSSLLDCYWDYFKIALQKSETIYLIGYSGKDDHINEAISAERSKNLIIVEYDNDQTIIERKKYWSKKLKIDINESSLILLKSILTYEFKNI